MPRDSLVMMLNNKTQAAVTWNEQFPTSCCSWKLSRVYWTITKAWRSMWLYDTLAFNRQFSVLHQSHNQLCTVYSPFIQLKCTTWSWMVSCFIGSRTYTQWACFITILWIVSYTVLLRLWLKLCFTSCCTRQSHPQQLNYYGWGELLLYHTLATLKNLL